MTIEDNMKRFRESKEGGIPLPADIADCIDGGGIKYSIMFEGEYYCTQLYKWCPKKANSTHKAPYCRLRRGN